MGKENREILVGCKLNKGQHHDVSAKNFCYLKLYLMEISIQNTESYTDRNFRPLCTGQSSFGVLWLLLGTWF